MVISLFKKKRIPKNIPAELEKIIKKIDKKKDKKKALREAYNLLKKRYKGERIATYIKLNELLINDLHKLWKKRGFLHCTNINYILRFILTKSKHFETKDIRIKWTLLWLSPHQYLEIKVGKKEYIKVDVWGAGQKIKFGDYAEGLR